MSSKKLSLYLRACAAFLGLTFLLAGCAGGEAPIDNAVASQSAYLVDELSATAVGYRAEACIESELYPSLEVGAPRPGWMLTECVFVESADPRELLPIVESAIDRVIPGARYVYSSCKPVSWSGLSTLPALCTAIYLDSATQGAVWRIDILAQYELTGVLDALQDDGGGIVDDSETVIASFPDPPVQVTVVYVDPFEGDR